MTRGERALRMVVAVGGCATGLVLGHCLDYRVAAPELHHQAVLHSSGHGYLPYVIAASLGVAFISAVAAGRLGYLRGSGRGGSSLGFRATAARLIVLQLTAFSVLETGERLAVGGELADVAGPLLWVGLALQVGTALVVAGLLRLIHRAAEEVGRLLTGVRSPARPGPRTPVPAAAVAAFRDPFVALASPRGPPEGLLSTA